MLPKGTTVLVLVAFFINQGASQYQYNSDENVPYLPCVQKNYGDSCIVCVCNATYCDTSPGSLTPTPAPGTYNWYLSSKAGLRLQPTLGLPVVHGSCNLENSTELYLNTSRHHQSILGFGGAFTGSAGRNIASLSPGAQARLLESYFQPIWGSNYILGRVPIGGSDFSEGPYTYDEVPGDVSMRHFQLAEEDLQYKIPYIRNATALNPSLQLVASPWTAPVWMKSNDQYTGYGFLLPQYYQSYANYLIRFLQAYHNNDINVFAITTGNEPLDVLYFTSVLRVPAMGWTPPTLGNFVANYLGPTLAASRYNATQLLCLDDQRILLPWFVQLLFQVPGVEKYIDGIAIHWYFDTFTSDVVLDATHEEFPNKYMLLSEASAGTDTYPPVHLGSWERGDTYILSIIDYMNRWSVGWLDWNLALDPNGGPTWTGNNVDSPVIVNATADEFYHQPMYYAIKHFSRFVPRGSTRVSITRTDNPVQSTAFVTPSSEVVIVTVNRESYPVNVTIIDQNNNDSSICLTLPARSYSTIVYTP